MNQEIRKQITNIANKHFLGRLYEDVFGYLRVYERLKLKVRALAHGIANIDTPEQFWLSILGDRFAGDPNTKWVDLDDGMPVRIRHVVLSEYAPKLPGRVWSLQGQHDLKEGLQQVEGVGQIDDELFDILDPDGKRKVIQAGIGSVRINPSENHDDHFMYLSAVGPSHWCVDYGIPLVVSRPAYEKIRKHAKAGATAAKSIEGVMVRSRDIPFKVMVPNALGSKLPSTVQDVLRYRPDLPKVFVYVSSPLSLDLQYSDSHPECTAWTMYETHADRQPFDFTYAKFFPETDSEQHAVDFIRQYVGDHDGKRIITDFDGMQPRLDAELPLRSDSLRIDNDPVIELITQLTTVTDTLMTQSITR